MIEDYLALHRPLPDCLVLEYLVTGEPLHAVIAFDEANDRLFIVTVYKPSHEEWQNDWRTKTSRCPLCGRHLKRGLAAMPFLLRDAVVLIKDVPAEICANCHEPFISGTATDGVIGLLAPLHDLRAEVLVLSYCATTAGVQVSHAQ